ncbi:cation:proton antiporter [Ferrimonas pelagia]|uniref:Sodium:proton antiporter n=1 Tax=Ferrimonas pelagia TaxID=1177826 RepID=A0ABP9ERE8_9GAMM
MAISVWMGSVLAFCSMAIFGCVLHRLLRLDLTLAALLSGVLGGVLIERLSLDIGLRFEHVHDLVFYLFLPILIFQAAWHLQIEQLQRWLLPAILLATLGVLITAGVIAGALQWAMGSPSGFPWIAALLTGAILAATDPVAVVTKLTELKASKELTTVFEGESLLNDATAVVLFSLILMLATGEQEGVTARSVLWLFAQVFFGGLVVGAALGYLTQRLIRYLNHEEMSVVLILLLAFGAFYLAEHVLHVSGMMAVATAALVANAGLQRAQPASPAEAEAPKFGGIALALDWLGLLFNLLIFCLMGLVITFDMFTERYLAMGLAIGAALLGRFVALAVCQGGLKGIGQGLPQGWPLLLGWGGLRGAIAVALVLSLPLSLSWWWTVQSMVFAVVLFSLLVQGTTFAALLRYINKKHPY